jgi:hypothetical protein
MFEMLVAISWLGWLLLSLLAIITIAVVATESWGWSTFSVLLTMVVLYFFTPFVFAVFRDPWSVVIYAAIYVGIGIVWAFVKWYFYVLNRRDAGVSKPPTAREHRSDITGWMAFWPWSAIWTLINDPVKRMYKALARSLEKVFDGISRRVFGV